MASIRKVWLWGWPYLGCFCNLGLIRIAAGYFVVLFFNCSLFFISSPQVRAARCVTSQVNPFHFVAFPLAFFCNGSIQVVTGPVVSSEDALSSLLLYCALLRYFFLLSVLLSSTPRRRRAFRAPPPTGVRGVARASAACSTLHTAT